MELIKFCYFCFLNTVLLWATDAWFNLYTKNNDTYEKIIFYHIFIIIHPTFNIDESSGIHYLQNGYKTLSIKAMVLNLFLPYLP